MDKDELDARNNVTRIIKNSSYYRETKLKFRMIDLLVNYGLSFMDTILLFQAHMNPNCQFFVTRDGVLLKELKRLKEEIGFRIGGVKIVNINEFLNFFKKTN